MNFFNGIGNFFSSVFGGNKDDEEKKRREREAQARERQQKQAEQSQKQQQRQQPQQQNKNVFGGNIQNSLQINTGFINEQKKKDTPLIEVKPSVTTENDNTLAKKLEENKKKQEQAKQSSANSPKFGYNNTQKAFEIDFKKQQADNNKSRDDARRVSANIIAKDTAEKQGDRFGADEQSKRRDSELRKRTNDIYEKTLYNELKNANSFESNFGRDQIKERAYNLARSQAMKEQGNNDETLAKQLNDQMLKSKRQVEDSRDRVQIMENARGQAIDTYKLGAEGISTGAGKALYGEDDNPDKLDMKDVARFLVNLPGGMASAPISALTKIAEVASGSELKKKGPNYDDDYERVALTPAQMAGRTASGLTDLFGLELGGSGKLMGSLGLKAAQKSGEQIAKTGVRQVAKNILTDGLKEGGEEAFQSIADDLSERGGFDEDTLKRALESFGWGAAGGGVMSGAGSGVDAVKGTDKVMDGFIAGPLALDFEGAKARGEVFEGKDGKPRFEVDDSGAKLKNVNGSTLGGVLDHPELYRQYPELKNVKVSHIEGKDSSFGGGGIQLGKQALDKQSSLLHETQHAIQDKEGFASGGSPAVKDFNYKDYISTPVGSKHLADNIRVAKTKDPSLTDTQAVNVAGHKTRQEAAYRQYRNLAGEAEARAVQARKDMPMSERYVKERSIPKDTSDISEKLIPGTYSKENITLFRGSNRVNEAQASPDKAVYHAETPEYAETYGKVSSKDVSGGVFTAKGIHAYDELTKQLRKALGKRIDSTAYAKLTGHEKAELDSWLNHTLEGERLSDQFNRPMPEHIKQAFDDLGIDYIRIPADQFKGTVGKIGHQTEIIELPKPKAKPRSTFYDSLDVPEQDLIILNYGDKAMSVEPEAQQAASPAVRNTVIDSQGNTVDTNTGEILDLPTVEPTNTVDTNEIAPNTSQDVAGDTQSRNPNAMSNILTEDYIAQMRERANKTQDADLSLNKELPMDYSSQAIAQRLQGAGITQDNINTLAKAGYGRSEIIAALNGSNDLNGANNPVALLRSIMDKNRKATNPTSAALNNNLTQKRLAGENNQDIAQQIIQELTGETTETFGSKAPANIDPNAKPYSGEMFGVDKNKGVIRVIDRDFRLPEAGVPITQETFINDYLADITEYIKDEVQLPSETMLENITGSDYASFREAIFQHTENNQSLDENVKSTYDELFRDSYKDLLEIARSSGRDIGELDYYLDPNKSVVDIANPDMAITSLVDTGFTEARTGSQFIDPETGEFSMDRVSSDAGVQDYAQKVIASLYETELQAGEKMKRNPNMTPENAIKSVKETKKMVDDITKISKDPKLAKDTVTAEDIYSKQTGFNILDKARQVGEMENNPVTVVQSKLGATKKALTTVQDVFTNVVFTRTLKDGTTLDTNLYDTGFKQYARAEQYSLVALNKFKESGVLEYASYDVANNIKNMFPNMSDADVDTLVNRAERNIGFAITNSSFTDVELETKIRNEYSKVYKQAAKLELFDMAKTTEFKDKRLKNMVNKQISNTLSHDVSLDGAMAQVLKLARGLQYSSKLGLNVSSALQQLLEIKRIAINDGVIDAGKSVAGAFTNRGENTGIVNFDNDMSRLSYDGDLTNRKGTLGLLNEGVDILNSKVMLKPFETAENLKNDVFVDQAVRDGKAQGLEGIALTDYVMDYVDKNALTGGYGKQIGLTDGEVGRNAFMFQSFAVRSINWDIDKFADLMRDPKNGQNWAKIARLIGVNGAIIVASSLALNKGAGWAAGIMGDIFNIIGDNYTDVDDEDMNTMDNIINHLPSSPMTQPIIDLYFNIRSEQIGAEDENREFNLGNVFNAESAKDFVLDFVPGSSQAGKTLAFSDEQAKGYAENKDGRIQRETPSDLWNTILGYTLGKNSTDKAKEYFDRPDYAEGFEQGGISGVVKEMSKDQAFDPIRTIFGLDNPREQERPLQAKYNADDPDNYNEVAKRAIEEVGVKYDVGSPQYKQAVKDWVELGRDYNHLKDNFRKNPEKYAKYEETYNEDTISQRKWAIIHEDKDVYDYMKKKALLEERDLGKEIDPIYHLDDGKAAMVIQKDGVFTGDDTKLNRDLYQTDWYDDFMNQRTAYYEQMGEFDNSGKTPRVQEWNGLRDQLNNIKQNDERYDILRQESQLYEEFGKGSPEVKDFYNNINYDALQELKNQKAVEELEIINRMRAIEGADPLSIEVYKSKTIYGDDSSSGKSYGKSGSGGSGSGGSGSSSKGSSGFTSHINLLGLGKEAPKFKTKTVKFKPNTSAGSRKKTKHSIGGRSKGSTS